MKGSPGESSLQNLPNIGRELARCLCAAGITTPSELRRFGSVEAAIRMGSYRQSGSACPSALYALEGAVRGVRWHAIPKAERDRLWREYQERGLA